MECNHVVQFNWLRNRLLNLFSKASQPFIVLHIVHEHDQLVPANVRDQIKFRRIAYAFLLDGQCHPLGNTFHNFVAGNMPQAFIYRLEVVQVD